jgi:hypothetical protein
MTAPHAALRAPILTALVAAGLAGCGQRPEPPSSSSPPPPVSAATQDAVPELPPEFDPGALYNGGWLVLAGFEDREAVTVERTLGVSGLGVTLRAEDGLLVITDAVPPVRPQAEVAAPADPPRQTIAALIGAPGDAPLPAYLVVSETTDMTAGGLCPGSRSVLMLAHELADGSVKLLAVAGAMPGREGAYACNLIHIAPAE